MIDKKETNKLKIVVVIIGIIALCGIIATVYSQLSNPNKILVAKEWNLMVVNNWNMLPEDYSVSLTELENGKKVDSRIYTPLMELFDAAKEEGLYLFVRDGYRTADEQKSLYNDAILEYLSMGYAREDAKKIVAESVALSGYSEHQLGLAVDINADNTQCTDSDAYLWLADNAYKYGFILRYPSDKEEITGIMHEPWHYRYVGVEVAKEIFERKICLEEYLRNE